MNDLRAIEIQAGATPTEAEASELSRFWMASRTHAGTYNEGYRDGMAEGRRQEEAFILGCLL